MLKIVYCHLVKNQVISSMLFTKSIFFVNCNYHLFPACFHAKIMNALVSFMYPELTKSINLKLQ